MIQLISIGDLSNMHKKQFIADTYAELEQITEREFGDTVYCVERKMTYMCSGNGQWAQAGGGSGGGLPPVTSSDNGKVLTVVSGGWDKGDAPSGAFVVTVSKSGQNIVADKTITEIIAAADAGTPVFAVIPNTLAENIRIGGTKAVVPMTGYTASPNKRLSFEFLSYYPGDEVTPRKYYICSLTAGTIMSYEMWTYTQEEIEKPPLTVVYTITGEDVDGVFPLSASETLATIAEAYAEGREVRAQISLDNTVFTVPYCVQTAANGHAVATLVGILQNVVAMLGQIDHYINEADNEVARLTMQPLSTVQMSYNSTTGALSMTNVPEENA